ncbi:unnamed protein product [Caenorhabditis nigoni]
MLLCLSTRDRHLAKCKFKSIITVKIDCLISCLPLTMTLRQQHSKELKERPPLSKKIADCPLLKVHEEANHELNNTTDRYQHKSKLQQ